jgi:glycosyltransferase involved in cell wall biosynthesis
MTELSVIIPTANRRAVLGRTLSCLAAQRGAGSFETIVVDDGSTDGTADVVAAAATTLPGELHVLRQENRGPSAARNNGLRVANGRISLFLGDDTWPRDDLVQRHARFHEEHPEPELALLGHVEWAPEAGPSPLMQWIDEQGIQFAHRFFETRVPGAHFYTSNVSVKTAFLRDQGGFDETFPDAALEDTELGLRLEAAGMSLLYDPDAVVDHYHPVDLTDLLARVGKVGRAAPTMAARFPDWRWKESWHTPPATGVGPFARDGALLVLHLSGLRTARVRRATWWNLCHRAFDRARRDATDAPRLERWLTAAASRDPAAMRPKGFPPARPTGAA